MKLTLDQARCIRCGRCTAFCPSQIFAKAPDGHIAIVERSLIRCIQCGHCVACCPKAAITLNDVAPESLPDLQAAPLSDLQRDMLFKARRSVRHYEETPVPRALLLEALEDARYAPTAMNTQSVSWLLVEGTDNIRALGSRVAKWASGLNGRYAAIADAFYAGGDPILRGAPAVIFAHAPASPWATWDGTAAVTYLELALHSRGLGTCWAGFVLAAAASGEDLQLPLPEGHTLTAGLMFGYPRMQFVRLPPRKTVQLTIA